MGTTKLSAEIVRITEAGINKQLNRSFVYSPFRFFFNMFKKRNPQMMEQVREMVRGDVDAMLRKVNGFKEEVFIVDGKATKEGNYLLKLCYNNGICLLRDDLKVKDAFRIMRDGEERQRVYEYVLVRIKDCAMNIIYEGSDPVGGRRTK